MFFWSKKVFFWSSSCNMGQQLQLLCTAKLSTCWDVRFKTNNACTITPQRKISMSYTDSCKMFTVGCAVWHVELFCWIDIHVIQFRAQEVASHLSVSLAVDGSDNASFVLETIRSDDTARSKLAPNRDSFVMHLYSGVSHVRWYRPKPNNFTCSQATISNGSRVAGSSSAKTRRCI